MLGMKKAAPVLALTVLFGCSQKSLEKNNAPPPPTAPATQTAQQTPKAQDVRSAHPRVTTPEQLYKNIPGNEFHYTFNTFAGQQTVLIDPDCTMPMNDDGTDGAVVLVPRLRFFIQINDGLQAVATEQNVRNAMALAKDNSDLGVRGAGVTAMLDHLIKGHGIKGGEIKEAMMLCYDKRGIPRPPSREPR